MRYSCPLSPIFHRPLKFVNRLITRIAQQLLDVQTWPKFHHPDQYTLLGLCAYDEKALVDSGAGSKLGSYHKSSLPFPFLISPPVPSPPFLFPPSSHFPYSSLSSFHSSPLSWSGVVVSTLASNSEVNLRRARLVLRWATVSGLNSRCRTFISVCNQPATQGQLRLPSLRGR